MTTMMLAVLGGDFALARLEAAAPVPAWASVGSFSSITRTSGELSVVCEAAAIPHDVPCERGWRCLRVAGTLDLSLTGVLASIAGPLAAAGVSIFAIATYDTDYVLVRAGSLTTAVESLRAAGHEVVGHVPQPGS
jgi:hypothetical protein